MKQENKKGFHITITSLDDGKKLVDEDSKAIIASVHLEDKTMGSAFIACNTIDLLDTINGAEKVTNNLKKKVPPAAVWKSILRALILTDEEHK